jgi:single-strand DNA-binding protein
MADTSITIIGNLTKDPEVRISESGFAMTSFSVAVNKSKKDKATGEWVDEPHFIDCVLLGDIAQNFGNSFVKGNRVIVTGEIQQRKYQGQDGTEKSKTELLASDIGASVRWANLAITRTERTEGGNSAPRTSAPKPASQPTFDEEPF